MSVHELKENGFHTSIICAIDVKSLTLYAPIPLKGSSYYAKKFSLIERCV